MKNLLIGNGGLCLRNVKGHYDLLTKNADLVKSMMGLAEDDFYAYCGANKELNFSVPPVNIARKFSIEYLLEHSIRAIGNELPFGVHGWTKFSADFYVKTLAKFGYDLQPLRSQMNNLDFNWMRDSLVKFALQRLMRRVQRGQSIKRYLPIKNFASLRVIRHPFSMMILTRLLMEDNSLADKIFLYDHNEQDLLLQDLTLQKLPHLLISPFSVFETNLMSAIERKGFAYGKRIVSFQREYLKRCEEIFRNLGK